MTVPVWDQFGHIVAVYFLMIRWPIKDMKPQLFILGNLNGKTYYFTFGVLFSDLSFFPLLKPKFFFLILF